jgi:hypothetical protein
MESTVVWHPPPGWRPPMVGIILQTLTTRNGATPLILTE